MVVENQARVDSDRRKIDKQVEKQRQRAEKQWRGQQRIDFRYADDALIQARKLAQPWRFHTLAELTVVEQAHYGQSGRPKRGTSPSHLSYRVTANVVADELAIEDSRFPW